MSLFARKKPKKISSRNRVVRPFIVEVPVRFYLVSVPFIRRRPQQEEERILRNKTTKDVLSLFSLDPQYDRYIHHLGATSKKGVLFAQRIN